VKLAEEVRIESLSLRQHRKPAVRLESRGLTARLLIMSRAACCRCRGHCVATGRPYYTAHS